MHISTDMYSCVGEHISLGICFFPGGEHRDRAASFRVGGVKKNK